MEQEKKIKKKKFSTEDKIYAVSMAPEIQNAVKVLFALHAEAKIKHFTRMTFDCGATKEKAKTFELIFQRVIIKNHE